MHFHIVTLFPEAFASYLDTSILKRARAQKKITVSFYNPRDYTSDKHRRVDRRPYGGGPGMVLAAEPVLRAVSAARGRKRSVHIIFLSPHGEQFSNKKARAYARTYRHLIIIAGHYEGVDHRVADALGAEEISLGPFVLTGGELPALAIIDAVSRQVPGVLGNEASPEEDRVAGGKVYTRPEEITYRGKRYRVPSVLLSGHHKHIERWKKQGGSGAKGGAV